MISKQLEVAIKNTSSRHFKVKIRKVLEYEVTELTHKKGQEYIERLYNEKIELFRNSDCLLVGSELIDTYTELGEITEY